MTNGFYNTDNFSDTEIKKFIKSAISKAYNVAIQSKYKNGVGSRQVDRDLSIEDVISNFFKSKDRKALSIVDRYLYNQGQIKKELCEYEISLVYDWTFLYIFVNEDNFNKLIKKYNLKLKEWN